MTDPMRVLQALRSSQQRLATLVSGLEPADLERGTSDEGWTVAEVLGHLGSQAEIFTLFIDAGLSGAEPPSNEAFQPIWDAWNAKSPESKAADALAADATFLDHVSSLDADHLNRLELSLFGMRVDAARLLGMRLAEHALHSWDVEVVFDAEAVLAQDAVELLVDGVDALVARVGKPEDQPRSISIVTSSPDRGFILDTGAVSLRSGDPAEDSPRLELTSEALIRLVYGRLDDRHLGSPLPRPIGVGLDDVRAVFPGV